MPGSRASRGAMVQSFVMPEDKPDTCCGGFISAHKGIYYLGIWSLIQSILVFIQSIGLIYSGVWWGIHLALFNAVYLM